MYTDFNSIIARMVKLISFPILVLIFFNNVHVKGYTHCYHKVFLHNAAEDNMLHESGLLLEVVVSHRAECVSLSHLQDKCNLILYNPSSSLCRLHHFDHANQTGAVTISSGWSNYARQCREPPSEPDCNVSDISSLDVCQSCFYDNAWKRDDMCISFKRKFPSMGGDSVVLNLNFDLEAGMVVVVKGPVFDGSNAVGVCLEDTDDPRSHLGLFLTLTGGSCDAYSESSDDVCNDIMPLVDLSGVTFTYRLTNSTIKLFVDGTFIIQYENLLRRNRMDVYGFGDVAKVTIIHTSEACKQP